MRIYALGIFLRPKKLKLTLGFFNFEKRTPKRSMAPLRYFSKLK